MTTPEATELAPCPVCNSAPAVVELRSSLARITCFDDDHEVIIWRKTKSEALAAWQAAFGPKEGK